MTYTYESSNPDHANRKKEVALFLLGSISDDIVKFSLKRGPQKFSMEIFNLILQNSSQHILIGWALWCVTELSEVLSTQDSLNQRILAHAMSFISAHYETSIRICACWALIQFAKFLESAELNLQSLLNDVVDLIYLADDDTIWIPIHALKLLTRLDDKGVATIAGNTTEHLLKMFIRHHDRGSIGQDLLEIFKIWCQYDSCKNIFCKSFTHYVLKILINYHKLTSASTGL